MVEMVEEETLDTPPALELSSRVIDHVQVELDVVLGEARLSIAELSRLDCGDLVPIDRKLSEAAEIRVNGRPIARGEIVSVDDKFAVRITEIGG